MGDWLIRPLTAADIVATRAMLLDVWHATYDHIYGATEVDAIVARFHAPEQLQVQAAATPASLIAVAGAAVVGHAHVTLDPADATVARLWRLYVAGPWQGQGLGAALMAAAFARMPAHEVQRLDVQPANRRAIAWYEGRGFVIERRIGDPHTPGDLDAFVMRRPSRR